jgi:hypothetical protein
MESMERTTSLPSMDWTCRDVLDAEVYSPDEPVRCKFCSTKIRWVHVLVHDDWDGSAESGGCCAARLCLGYDAEAAEREVKNRVGRLQRFVDPRRWTRSRTKPENIVRKVKLADRITILVTVFLRPTGGYGICLSGPGKRTDFEPELYASQTEAKVVAFELVERRKGELRNQ